MFAEKDIIIANKTSRSYGAVGKNAIVPRIVRNWIDQNSKILDFGAGVAALHTQSFIKDGFNVTAHEFGSNQRAGTHDYNALINGPYDLIYASNVLNVQSNINMLLDALGQIYSALKTNGIFIANFPKAPRKILDLTPAKLAEILKSVFNADIFTVRPNCAPILGKVPAEPVFFIRKRA